jgi:hypothetical protein
MFRSDCCEKDVVPSAVLYRATGVVCEAGCGNCVLMLLGDLTH